MLNILVPIAGKSPFFREESFPFPKPLIEIRGIPMIQYVVNYLNRIKEEKRFVFIVNQSPDCDKFHLDNTLRLIAGPSCIIITQFGETRGAVCSSLLAIEHIDNNDPLIITNGDQFIDEDINTAVIGFKKRNLDGAVLCFESIHPKWSYVRLDETNKVIETAEKNPISKHAIAGFYYFRNGAFFIEAAGRSILKDSNVNGLYYIAPTLNEMILDGKNVGMQKIDNANYHSFYSLDKIKQFEQSKLQLLS